VYQSLKKTNGESIAKRAKVCERFAIGQGGGAQKQRRQEAASRGLVVVGVVAVDTPAARSLCCVRAAACVYVCVCVCVLLYVSPCVCLRVVYVVLCGVCIANCVVYVSQTTAQAGTGGAFFVVCVYICSALCRRERGGVWFLFLVVAGGASFGEMLFY
jgi:hypothetical protein